jgi:hypothetical protein
VRGFWLECRRGLATPGLALGPLSVGLVAGMQAHDGLPLDVLVALGTAVFILLLVVPTVVLMRKIPWVRRRTDTSGQWRRRPEGSPQPAAAERPTE